ncbi:MAG: DEAD/DEAH box helicase family protein, partial [Dehalococcoidia bacterium]
MDIFARKSGHRPKQSQPEKLNPAAARLDVLGRGKPKRDPVAREIERIVNLPLIRSITPEEVEAFCKENQLVTSFNSGWRLFPQQVDALIAYDLYDGGFFPVSVGAGKTLISLMLAERAFKAGIKRTLLLVPPQVYPQLVNRDITYARNHVPISVQFLKLGGITMKKRLQFARSGRLGCYILPYSCLSTVDSSDLLEFIKPDLIIADEAHMLRNASSARTKRIRRYIDKHEPRMVAMSGTITSKSILDYWHIISSCLHDNSPLPKSSHIVRQWGQVLDAQQAGWNSADEFGAECDNFRTEPVMPLVRWAQKHFPEESFPGNIRGFRKAYKFRLNTAPGVVVSAEHEIGTSLLFSNKEASTTRHTDSWAKLKVLIDKVKDDFEAPNGDEIDHAIHQFSWLYQLSAGFYNDLYWPTPERLAGERGIGELQAADLLDRAQWHHKLLQLYHSTLRKWLTRRSKPGLDTPFLVGGDMASHGAKRVGSELFDAWRLAKDADFDGRPDRRSRPVRVCPYKIVQAADWAESMVPQGEGAVFWYFHKEIGIWLTEELKNRGLDVIHCPAGANDAICAVGDPEVGGKGDQFVVASIKAHHIGKNLYAFQHQFIVQWPRSAEIAEQMVGRLHRTGQTADELVITTNNTTDTDNLNFAACLNDSCYIHDTTGVRQKLM